MPSASLWAIFSGKIILRLSRPAEERALSGASRQLSRRESQDRGGNASCLSFEREPRAWRECFLPLPLGEVSPKVTERAHPLPCGELPPQRLRGLSIGEARKKCNGDDRRQWRIQGGAVGAAACRMRVPLKARSGRWAPQPVGSSASKSLCPCRAKHAAFASQTGLRLKSPTGAFMPSGHRRPFWFSFGAKREHLRLVTPLSNSHPNCKSKMQTFCVSAQKNCIFIFCPETLQKALTTAFLHAILNT